MGNSGFAGRRALAYPTTPVLILPSLCRTCNFVGVDNSGEPMSNDDSGAAHHEPVERLLHHSLRFSIQSASGFV